MHVIHQRNSERETRGKTWNSYTDTQFRMATLVHPPLPTEVKEEGEMLRESGRGEGEKREDQELGSGDEIEILPPSFHQLAEDWNKYFIEVGDWLVR